MLAWVLGWVERQRERRERRRQEKFREWMREALRPESVERLRQKRAAADGRLVLEDDGFHVLKKGRRMARVCWDDVLSIRVWQRDVHLHDLVCLAFEVGDSEWVETWESMADFGVLARKVEETFPGIPEGWYEAAALPPFAANVRTLWSRPRQSA